MADTFQPIGAVAASVVASLPLNPTLTFRHVPVHIIHRLARLMAREAIKEQLRNEGFRARYALPWEIIERATEYLAQHPEVCREALTRAHLIDEAEGQRKDRQRLRWLQLARLVRKLPVR